MVTGTGPARDPTTAAVRRPASAALTAAMKTMLLPRNQLTCLRLRKKI